MLAYAEACRSLERAGVPYVIIGVFGINLYAERAGTVLTTADCDLLLPPDAEALSKALECLKGLGYAFEAGGEPFLADSPGILPDVVRARANIVAYRPGAQLDLALEIAGCDFPSLWKRHRRFRVEGGILRVAPLKDLIRSKELAGRPKDKLFLETYREALSKMLGRSRRRPR